MKGRLRDEKAKRRKVMFDEELKCKKLKNEIQDLNDCIFELDEDRKVAEANEKVVREKYYDTVRDAQYRLHRWHQEREKRRDAENKMAELDKHAKKQDEMYAHLLEDFNEITSDPKHSMQKEWDDEEAARNHGGGQRWPTWVVQLICELLVTGPHQVLSHKSSRHSARHFFGRSQRSYLQSTLSGNAVLLWRSLAKQS